MASAADSRTDHTPASLPGIEPAAAAPHVANDSTSSTPPVRVKKPRLTSLHSGVRNRSTSPPETVSARTSAVTPAGPDTARAYPGDDGLLLRRKGNAEPPKRANAGRLDRHGRLALLRQCGGD